MATIDLNADLGEGMPAEAQIIGLISSANLAGGGHAGGGQVLEQSVQWCRENSVAIGAHPSYPDRENFGRVSRISEIDDLTLLDSLVEQIEQVRAAAGGLHHVKAHGALYNDSIVDSHAAEILLAAVSRFGSDLPILTMDHGVLAQAARAQGRPVITEVFADRAYREDGTLVPRSEQGAIIDSVEAIAERMLRFLDTSTLITIDGVEIHIKAESICIHGDNPHAAEVARHLHAALVAAGHEIRSV